MKPASPFRFFLVLLCVGAASLAFAKTEKAASSGTVPVPFAKEARFSRRYDPNLKPERPAVPAMLAPIAYPEKWRAWGQPAYAIVAFLIKDTGNPIEIQCIEATDQAFAKEAIKAIERSYFIPALKNQQGVTSKVVRRIDFTLEKTGWAAEGIEESKP